MTAPGAASASIGSDRSSIAQLEQQVAARGAQIQSIVAHFNATTVRLSGIERALVGDRAALRRDHRSAARASVRLRAVAVDAYISAASGSDLAFAAASSASTLPEREVYLGVANGTLNTVMTTLTVDRHRTSVMSATLRLERARTVAALQELIAARQASEQAIAGEHAMLGTLGGNLLALVTAANARHTAELRAEEAAIAKAQLVSAEHIAAPAPPAPVHLASPGAYANPLRAVGGLTPNRIDQGVDYDGVGPLYAIGDGVVLSTVSGGWPGGTYITYRLTDGPAAGLVAYAAEDLEPTVQVGQVVTPNTVIGQVYEGSTGIELGWANSDLGNTMASAYGQFGGENTTAFGYNFAQLLESLGAPGGVSESSPTGAVPAGWPQW